MGVNFMYYAKIYLAVVLQDIKTKMSYRADFVINAVSILLTNLLYLASFYLLFYCVDSLGGWGFYEILFFYSIMLISTALMQTFFDNLWELDKRLMNGEFIKYYFKPINILFYYISETFNIKGVIQSIFGTWLLVYAIKHLELHVSVLFMVKFCLCVFAAGVVYVGIMLITSSLSFWFLDTITILMFVSKAKDYARYPLSIYGKVLKFIFTFIFPIGFISYYPSIILMNKISYQFILGLVVAAIVIFYIGYRMWILGTRKYSGTGN